MKKIAISQSNYIPWKGYFDLIGRVDEFVLYDDMQFTKNDWRNRNMIKTPRGTEWISIPVGHNIRRRICDVELPDNQWRQKHWKTFEYNYSRAPHFQEVAALLAPIYLAGQHTHLSALNREVITTVCAYLGIRTKISSSRDYQLPAGKSERLAAICTQAGATEYISGPAAQDYLDKGVFDRGGIKVTWFSYEGYPEYPQLWGKFIHNVSVVDLLFNCGHEASRYMKLLSP
jgi:hypothetical protein